MVWSLRRYNVTLPLHDGHTIIEVCLDQKTSNFPTYSLKKLKFSIIISQVVEKGNYQNFHKWWKKATNPNPNPKFRTWSWSWATQSLLRYIRIQLI